MSKRIIYQCDRCAKHIEQEKQPGDWVTIIAERTPDAFGGNAIADTRLWCWACWSEVRQPLAREG